MLEQANALGFLVLPQEVLVVLELRDLGRVLLRNDPDLVAFWQEDVDVDRELVGLRVLDRLEGLLGK